MKKTQNFATFLNPERLLQTWQKTDVQMCMINSHLSCMSDVEDLRLAGRVWRHLHVYYESNLRSEQFYC